MSKITKLSQKQVDEKYSKLTDREHILKRPGMTIGEVKPNIDSVFTFDPDTQKITKNNVEFSPGLLKLFDEILTNAIDYSLENTSVTDIKVTVDQNSGEMSVWNNGPGIPIMEHSEHKLYIPEMIFGHLRTGSNYDDNKLRAGGGMNGIGAKAVNIFSKKFVIETIDSVHQKKYIQTFSENMNVRDKPKITSNKSKSYTKITWIPDYARFGMPKGLDQDTFNLLYKRTIDSIVSTATHVKMYFNGKHVKGKSLKDYVKYYFDDNTDSPEAELESNADTECSSSGLGKKRRVFYDTQTFKQSNGKQSVQLQWEIAVVENDVYDQVSFVNGLCTIQGGTHVKYITDKLITKLKGQIEPKLKNKDTFKPAMVKEKLFVFVRSTLVRPNFNSQTKEYLTTPVKDFGCYYDITDDFAKKIIRGTKILTSILEYATVKESIELKKKTDGTKKKTVFIPKLEDATWAGTSKSQECTLMLTEGDSGKTFAMRVRPDNNRFGTFPLKGKCVSADTKIPLWNGDIKTADNIEIGDVLIGEDGTPRNVLTLFNEKGKMYKISQDRGESYKVNDEHILTICMPEHKTMYWTDSNCSWKALYWDQSSKNVKVKNIIAPIRVPCNICNQEITVQCLSKHYKRHHKNIQFEPYTLDLQKHKKLIQDAKIKLETVLKTIPDYTIIDINIQDYLRLTKLSKRKLKGVRSPCVKWDYKPVQLDPYVLGLWLGDGCQTGYNYIYNNKSDTEIMDYLKLWGESNDVTFKKIGSTDYSYSISSTNNRRKKGYVPLKKQLSCYGLIKNKHIPKEYLVNSKEVRLQLLAGLIDTDGHVDRFGRIEITQGKEHLQLIHDIAFLSRSLGFYAHLTEKTAYYTYKNQRYNSQVYRLMISGETECIPTKLPRKKTRNLLYKNFMSTGTLKVEEIPDELYVGIGVDATNRFAINDFTITHNCLNIRDATHSQLINNEEINNLKQILGLEQNKVYKNTSSLRYGRIMMLVDADTDGTHILGLIMNILHAWWPSLLEPELKFFCKLRTPIVKVRKGKHTQEFFTEQDYNEWYETLSDSQVSQWKIHYYKGLGTSTKDDAKAILPRINELSLAYYHKDSKCDESVKLAFEKDKNTKSKDVDIVKYTDMRKNWLKTYDRHLSVSSSTKRVCLSDMIHKELIHFSNYDNIRSIPSMVDGLKPSQRKIIHYMLKKDITSKLIKVAQLAGYVSAETSYHHGENSLQQAIIGLGQDFIGSNNYNLLTPEGTFGSRFKGGADAASPRYIFTRLEEFASQVYNKFDSNLLAYLTDDGMEIEPEFFVPVLPMILINGADGIGTGYSTFIPPFNIHKIIENLEELLKYDEGLLDKPEPELVKLTPWYKDYKGSMEADPEKPGVYITKGTFTRLSKTKIKITELPIGTWITPYKEFLETLCDGYKPSKGEVNKNIKHTLCGLLKSVEYVKTEDENTDVQIIVEFLNADCLSESDSIVEKDFKLSKNISTNNMHLFDNTLSICKYNTPEDILIEYYDLRVEYYQKRKELLLKTLGDHINVLENKIRFINEYLDGTLKIARQSNEHVEQQLCDRNFDKQKNSFDYLLSMAIRSLTKTRIDAMTSECKSKKKEHDEISAKSQYTLWLDDLEKIKKLL